MTTTPLKLEPTTEESHAKGRPRASGDALRDRGLEHATRRNGVAMHHTVTEAVCRAAGVRFERTKAGKLWIEAWAVAALSTLKGKARTLKVRVLRHYVEATEEERAALLTTYRTGSREALKAMVDPASWTKAGQARAARDEEFRRRAERKARSPRPAPPVQGELP